MHVHEMGDPSSGLMLVKGVADKSREYRKGNWTLHETLVLIAAKKLDDERRMKGGDSERSKTTELRWKWIENYCWKNGCLRSQNQCNDKWDNLLKDYKKVRDYELRLGQGQVSYWHLEKHERKERNLPSNVLPQIYEALVGVVEKDKWPASVVRGSVVGSMGCGLVSHVVGSGIQPASIVLQQQQQHHYTTPSVLPLPPPLVQQAQALPELDTDGSEDSNSSAKRKRTRKGSSSSNTKQEIGTAVSKSASILAETLLACEEKRNTRHKELLNIEERRLQIEEAKVEINSQGINGLIGAVNKLANAVLALVPNKNPTTPNI